MLVLASNDFKELADLDGLSTLTRLMHLVLNENPVTRKDVSSPIYLAREGMKGRGY